MWFLVCLLLEVNLYNSPLSGVGGLSAVRRLEVVCISEVRNTLYNYMCRSIAVPQHVSVMYGGCPYLGVSVNRGSTVIIHTAQE